MEGIPANFTFSPVIEYAPPPPQPPRPNHLIFGRGTQIGGLAGTVIWFTSVAVWAYMWMVFTASSIYFVETGFDIMMTLKKVIFLAFYPLVSIPMYLFVVLPYRFIYCPLHHWWRNNKVGQTVEAAEIAAEETWNIFSFSPIVMAYNTAKAAWDLMTGVEQEKLEYKVEEREKPPKYCVDPQTHVATGCMPGQRVANPSFFSWQYWFCRDVKSTESLTYNCNPQHVISHYPWDKDK